MSKPAHIADQLSPKGFATDGAATSQDDPPQIARSSQVPSSNAGVLLQLLREHGDASKADLVRLSDLTASTVSRVVGELVECGLLEQRSKADSFSGRTTATLHLNAQYGFVAGVDVGGTRVRMMLADLSGEPVADWETRLEEDQKNPLGVVKLVRKGLDSMTAKLGGSGRLLHVTVGAPGITDVSRGVVLAAPNLQEWNDVPLRAMLEDELSIPAEIENDTNLAAVGEHAVGVARGCENFVFVAVGTGLGAGIYLRGALHHGATWSAGELGYLPVIGSQRQRITLRETGQLEDLIGGSGIEKRWQVLLRQTHPQPDRNLLELHASQIFDLAAQGDAHAESILQSTARLLADALSTVTLMYNPELVVLGGGVGSHSALCASTDNFMRENEFALPKFRSSVLGTKAQLFGAVSVSLSAVDAGILC